MIPYKDTISGRRFSYVTFLMIAACVWVFIACFCSEQFHKVIFFQFGYFPGAEASSLERFSRVISSLFIHSSIAHIGMNIWYLYIFGQSIEDQFGHIGYFFVYVFCGAAAVICQSAALPAPIDANVVFIGASGSISGILGAYLISFPRAKILFLLPLVIFFIIFEIPAFFTIVFWYVSQFIPMMMYENNGSNFIAWWGHLGGFFSGVTIAILYRIIFLPRKGQKILVV